MERHELLDGGIVYFDRQFFGKEAADLLYEFLVKKVPWKQEKGKYAPFPRLTAWYADTGLTYTYSGVTHYGLEWLDILSKVRKKVEKAAQAPMNSLLLNYYRDGKDSIGFHTDAEPELGANPIVPSISLGAERTFILKHIKTKEQVEYQLPHGSLLIMAGTLQHHWLHGLPKSTEEVGGRINLTFRNIVLRTAMKI